jgi:hypothetical protein
MIRFTLQEEPTGWDARCRARGRKWLARNLDYIRPQDYWTEFEPELRAAFNELCAFSAMWVMKADMDHFIPVAMLKKRGQHELAYEWSNFRYVEGVINQSKRDYPVLDPFEVQDDWFTILLPSLQLVLTDKVPVRRRKRAMFTLERLKLRDGEVVLRYRQGWFEMYRSRELTLDGLRRRAPQIARAVERDLRQGKDWRYEAAVQNTSNS